MKLSPLFVEIWSFETIHSLNFKTQRQKRHDVTNDVKVNFLFCRLVFFVSCVSQAFGSVHCCLVVTCWERADLLALVGAVSWARCGT